MANFLDGDQLHKIEKGKMQQLILRNQISEALSNNPHNDNYVISSPPGMGKSYETEQFLSTLQNKPLCIEGNSGIFNLIVDIATAVYLRQGEHIYIVLDDCDVLFEPNNINIAKKMFDQSRKMVYGKNWRSLKGQLTELQIEAIEHFSSEERAGFDVSTENITFLILTNRYLPTVNDVEKLEEGSKKHTTATDLYAIRRRTQCNPIEMPLDVLWGYVANVVLNEQICEKFKSDIVDSEKYQIVEWMDKYWDRVTERNLSLAEKMTKDMVRYPEMYLDIWKNNYLDY